jgi:hypothetical protein
VRRAHLLGILAAAALGCGEKDPEDEPIGSGGAGGSAAGGSGGQSPVELIVQPGLFVGEEQPLRMLEDGDAIDLSRAVQGGHVIYIGAQVEQLTSDIVEIRTRLRHPDTRVIEAEEARSIVMRPVPGTDGLMQPDLRSRSQVSHLPACPNYAARSIRDEPWLLEVSISEIEGPGAGATELGVTPVCAQEQADALALCECECEPDYVLGKCPP